MTARSLTPVCHYCTKSGRVMFDCWLLNKKETKIETVNAFVSSKSNKRSIPDSTKCSIGSNMSEIREEFDLLCMRALFYLMKIPINCPLKYLGTPVPLPFENAFLESTPSNVTEGGCVNILLHQINLVSHLIN